MTDKLFQKQGVDWHQKYVDMGDGTFAERVIAGGRTPRLTATYTRAADATAYQAGDLIGNSTTAASVVPITWDIGTNGSGRITGCRVVVEAASGTVALTNLAFDLYLFRPNTNIPFTAGSYPADNAAVNLTAAAHRDLLAILSFVNSGWRNNIAANAAAGAFLNQEASVNGVYGRPYAPFNFSGLPATTIRGLIVAQAAWNPGNVAQQFDFALDVDLD